MKIAVATEARHAAHLKGLNLERVLAVAMERSGAFTRGDLILATHLSAPTVGAAASQLTRLGVLRDLGTGPSTGGRRPSFMEFNARHGVVAGIDIGPTHTRLAVADLRGERLAERMMPTPGGVGPRQMLVRIAAGITEMLAEAPLGRSRLLAAAAGVPGAVDRERGIVVALAPNLRGWSRVPVGALLRRALKVPVVVENDVNLAVLGEHWKGAARGHDTCAFVHVGTGIGAGIILDGTLHRGHHFLAGEIALMCMGPEFVERDFGARGCLETLAGLRSILGRWNGGRRDGDAMLGRLFQALERGDRKARAAVDEAATLIGIAVANLGLVLDPSLVVLGGALAAPLIKRVRQIVARTVPTPGRIVVSELGEEAPLWGTLLVAMTEARMRLRETLRARA